MPLGAVAEPTMLHLMSDPSFTSRSFCRVPTSTSPSANATAAGATAAERAAALLRCAYVRYPKPSGSEAGAAGQGLLHSRADFWSHVRMDNEGDAKIPLEMDFFRRCVPRPLVASLSLLCSSDATEPSHSRRVAPLPRALMWRTITTRRRACMHACTRARMQVGDPPRLVFVQGGDDDGDDDAQRVPPHVRRAVNQGADDRFLDLQDAVWRHRERRGRSMGRSPPHPPQQSSSAPPPSHPS